MRIVVCGGGVIGAACAYFLSRRGAKVVVVERHAIACGASGKSGGFLARDWCDSTPVQSLARRSFGLHAQLADQLGTSWSYRRLDTFAGNLSLRPGQAATSHAQGWLSENVQVRGRIGSTDTTAQVDPSEFTSALMRAAIDHGATLHLGTTACLVRDRADDRIVGVAVGEAVLEADAAIIAMGPWSQLARDWMPIPLVYGLKGHSILFRTGDALPPQALFLECEEADGQVSSPEVFPRANGTTYVCAISSAAPLPLDPAAVAPDLGAIERLQAICAGISPILADAPIIATQACFRPVTDDGLPIIGRVSGIEGAYVATGHSVWGILNAPATGEALADLILEGAARHVDITAFDPTRGRRSGYAT